MSSRLGELFQVRLPLVAKKKEIIRNQMHLSFIARFRKTVIANCFKAYA